jgi:hypothetical protein
VGGACIPAAIESASLPDYDGERIFPTGATPCFDEAACLEQEQLVPLEQDCTFALPPADSTSKDGRPHVNVAVQWRDAPRRIIALEYGNTQEGWTVTAEGRGKLSAGVCLSYFEPGVRPEERAVPEKAEGVYVSVRCPAHDPAEPFCRAADGHVAVGRTFR